MVNDRYLLGALATGRLGLLPERLRWGVPLSPVTRKYIMAVLMTDIWSMATDILLESGPIPTPRQAMKVLKRLLEDEGPYAQLEYIKNRVDGIVRAQLLSGYDFLELADAEEDIAKQKRYLEKSLEFFVLASNSELQPEKSRALEYAALSLTALGNLQAASERLQRALTSINSFRAELKRKAMKTESAITEFMWLGKFAVTGVTVVGLPLFYAYDKRQQKKMCSTLFALFDAEKQAQHLCAMLGVHPPEDCFFSAEIYLIEKHEFNGNIDLWCRNAKGLRTRKLVLCGHC